MGRKNRKKKTKSAGGNPPSSGEGGGPPAAGPSKPAGTNKRTYLKIKAIFKCTGEACGKKWSSVHAWERDEVQDCEECGGKGDVDRFLDEMCELDNYECGNAACPLFGTEEGRWQSIHDGNEEECYGCGVMVRPSGTQVRFGRHFWFACTRKECGQGWEDFSLTPQRTQRCSACQSRGDIQSTQRVYWQGRRPGEDGMGRGGGGGGHKAENCDMCMDLQRYGKARSCMKFKKVECRIEGESRGHGVEVITAIS